MKARILLSTGAFTGRINGRDHRLAIKHMNELECDGFELMLFPDWLERLDEIIGDYQKSGIKIAALHAVKDIGDSVGSPDIEKWESCRIDFEKNCSAAEKLGAEKIITHIWGRPDSDNHMEIIAERCGKMLETARDFGLDFVPENTVCYHSPLRNLESLCKALPGLGVTIDTRPAQFHAELEETAKSPVFRQNMRHIHINDYSGGYMQWDALYPIPQPGGGQVDFDFFFAALREIGYSHTVTLEAPSMRADGVDSMTLNRSLEFIRKRL